MEDNKFLSVKEFAERAAVSVQSVYKRINKPDDIINKYTQTIDKKIYISERAIEDIYNNSVAEPAEPAGRVSQKSDDSQNKIVEILQEQIKQLQNEIDFKNKEIEKLQKQLEESSNRETNYQQLLNQQQQLNGIEKQRVLQLEQETQTTKKKKGIFGIFKKKYKENNVNGEGE